MKPIRSLTFASGAFFLSLSTLEADVTLPSIFGDHMVLQQGVSLPVWGMAAPGEDVKVTVGSHSASTKADDQGHWMVKLEPLPMDHTALTMEVVGKNSLKFTDVLAGEVWVCSGQSNMEFGLGNAHNASVEVPKADIPELRLFMVPKRPMYDPQFDVQPGKPFSHWVVCTPQSVLSGGWNGFSAVGYFFGKEIHEKTGEPVGLIGTYFGGTPAQAWLSIDALKANPALAKYVTEYQTTIDQIPKLKEAYPAAKEVYLKEMADWNSKYKVEYDKTMADWAKAFQEAQKSFQPLPGKPSPPAPMPKGPDDGTRASSHHPSGLFNGMVYPIIPYAIKGAIWYQGEANAAAPTDYDTLFQCLIQDWRTRWNEGDFPFLFVQLANFQAATPLLPVQASGFARVRDNQFRTLKLKNTGMASAIDVGVPKDIHPKDKEDVGHRLALEARRVAYGETNLVSSGPLYDSMQVEGNKIRIKFKFANSGLKIGAHPAIQLGQAQEEPPTELAAFAIAGEDKKWVSAKATIDGSTVVVSSDAVPNPVAVRYGWANNPDCHLYNQEGLPASPFRTDDWENSELGAVPPLQHLNK